MFKGPWRAPHETIYGHKKKVCLGKTFPLGHFMLHFITFLICQMTEKASNASKSMNALQIMIISRFKNARDQLILMVK